MLEKTYQPAAIEPRIAALWEHADAFAVARPERREADATPYTIVIPPPNVTGSLHMGHALNNTLQDILCRFERMRGCDVLWQPGMDHAGIATQMVVERQLADRQEPDRRAMGRDAFLERVWRWKEESGGTIGGQLRRLGASCDWSRERFTMDEGLSRAVLRVSVELYREGLIYKDKRLVNWDPKFQTAISDLEVENGEVDGHMWHFKYPLAGGETYEYVEKNEAGDVILRETRDYISIATTRPETMLGDGAVAVHPDDTRYAPIVGKLCEIPVGPKAQRRLIPIITDEYPDPAFGSGAVKITGAHDFNDYAVARRNAIPMYRLMDDVAAMRVDGDAYADEAAKAAALVEAGGTPDAAAVDAINLVPDAYRGLDRFEARKRVVADIDADGLMIGVEKKLIMQPFGDRSGVVIEPMLTDQWFCDAATLAKPAIEAVESGETTFVPKVWEKTYFEWMRNIQPWCISRQLWWGHRIPAWYGPDGEIFVAFDEAEAVSMAQAHYGETRTLTRDEDVLDTWFSSALWPFSTLGWPDDTDILKRHYKTDVLVTGFDIIFFWVARMMMMGLHFKREVPFHTVYIHALVRDEKGAKMSKSKGNVMNPLDIIEGVERDTLIEKRVSSLTNKADAKRITKATRADYPDGIAAYGADALRFTLAIMAAQGRDVKLSIARVEGYRNFATKLWNASRFAEMNEAVSDAAFDPAAVTQTLNRWIVGETERTALSVTAALEGYRFNEAAAATYQFVWGVFCDWYLELIKPILNGDDEAAKRETRACVAWTLDQTLALLHPFMPFVTEELWQRTGEAGNGRAAPLALSTWPTLAGLQDEAADVEIGWVIALVEEVRSVRDEMKVPAGAKVPLVLVSADKAVQQRATRYEPILTRLARLDDLKFAKAAPKGSAQFLVGETSVALPLEGLIDMAAERTRLAREIEKAQAEIAKIDGKLTNEAFMAKAPEAVIEENRERRVEFNLTVERLGAALERLKAASE
ncbi:MAG: valine--tRNA ligase [Pseudomonadota bacterium]